MHKFMIKSLRVSGERKIDGIVNFTDGLNIIRGRSNTGKTWVLKCIYYLFSSDTRPYSPLTGYDTIEGIFNTERYGEIIITRKLGEEKVRVSCKNEKVEDGDYDTNYGGKGPLYLNDLWIHILGIDETVEIPISSRYARNKISWTNIASVFFVDENEIDKAESIVIKDSTYETSLVSSLYFMLTGDYKKGVAEIDKSAIATAKKKAVVDYIEELIGKYSDQKVDYIKKLEELDGTDIEARTQELTEQIQSIQQEVKELIEDNSSIAKQIAAEQQRDANCKVLLDRYESLISQYKADLKRMDFIAKGEQAVKKLPANGVCPFCGGNIEIHKESYLDAIDVEIKRIASEITVIVATEQNVKDEMNLIKTHIDDLQKQRSDINDSIEEKNQLIQNYHSDMNRFKDYVTLQNGINFVNEQLAILGEKKVSELKRKKNPPLYHAKNEFEKYVGTDFNTILNKILKDCNYRFGYASWDFKNFDILMDGVPKSEDQGKGYRSFLNSVTALMLYEYFNTDDVHVQPGFLMIDTPLLGFDENEDGFDGETIKNGLYQYFIDHQGSGQVIIVDNLNVIPDIDFEAKGINVITYSKDEKDGHVYGFLPSWRKDLPKEKK